MAFITLNSIELGLDEVQIWPIRLSADPAAVHEMERLLSPDETARADRFVTAELRSRYVLCRGALRRVLEAITQCPAETLQFHYETWGKPQLKANSKHGLPVHFNVSHSADAALIACARSTVGVDIEKRNDRTNHRAIAAQVISDVERPAWEKIAPKFQSQAILSLWVCKEALLKALGIGIADALKKIAFPLPIPAGGCFLPTFLDAELLLQLDEQASCQRNSWIDPETWRVHFLCEWPECYAAVATTRDIRRLVIHPEPCATDRD